MKSAIGSDLAHKPTTDGLCGLPSPRPGSAFGPVSSPRCRPSVRAHRTEAMARSAGTSQQLEVNGGHHERQGDTAAPFCSSGGHESHHTRLVVAMHLVAAQERSNGRSMRPLAQKGLLRVTHGGGEEKLE
jgi:hypothetical protein